MKKLANRVLPADVRNVLLPFMLIKWLCMGLLTTVLTSAQWNTHVQYYLQMSKGILVSHRFVPYEDIGNIPTLYLLS